MAMATTTALSLAATALSTGIGVYGSIQQSKAQQAQAEYQSEVAKRNQELAEQQASAQRKSAYDNMIARRQETARLIGKQRAAMGASGAAVDVGSNLDLQEDTAYQGEIDAINEHQKGMDAAYNAEIQAWNYGTQAEAYESQADSAGSNAWMGAAGSALGGIAKGADVWGRYLDWQDKHSNGQPRVN